MAGGWLIPGLSDSAKKPATRTGVRSHQKELAPVAQRRYGGGMAQTHDVTSLPQWAQRKIEKLERDVQHYRYKNDLQDAGETEVFVKRYGAGLTEDNMPLPPGSTVVFDLGHGNRIEAQVGERGGVTHLGVNARGHDHALLFAPAANNYGYLYNRDLTRLDLPLSDAKVRA